MATDDDSTGTWVVEVRKAGYFGSVPSAWRCVAEGLDEQTAIAVADALHNFVGTGLVGGTFHTRTRLTGGKGK